MATSNQSTVFSAGVDLALKPAQELKSDGWIWLDVRCTECGNRLLPRLDAISSAHPDQPLDRYLRRLICGLCRRRNLTFDLCRWRMSYGQPWLDTQRLKL